MLQLHRNKNDYVLCLYDTDKKVGRSSATDSNGANKPMLLGMINARVVGIYGADAYTNSSLS